MKREQMRIDLEQKLTEQKREQMQKLAEQREEERTQRENLKQQIEHGPREYQDDGEQSVGVEFKKCVDRRNQTKGLKAFLQVMEKRLQSKG